MSIQFDLGLGFSSCWGEEKKRICWMEEAEMIKPFWKEGKKRKEVARSSGTRRMTRVRPSPPIATYVPIFWSLAQIDLTHASSAEHSIHLAPLQTATGNSSAFYHSAANKGVVCANRVSPAMKAGQLFFFPSVAQFRISSELSTHQMPWIYTRIRQLIIAQSSGISSPNTCPGSKYWRIGTENPSLSFFLSLSPFDNRTNKKLSLFGRILAESR